MKDRSDDPSHHERTLLPQSYISLPSSLACNHYFKNKSRRAGVLRSRTLLWGLRLTWSTRLRSCSSVFCCRWTGPARSRARRFPRSGRGGSPTSPRWGWRPPSPQTRLSGCCGCYTNQSNPEILNINTVLMKLYEHLYKKDF